MNLKIKDILLSVLLIIFLTGIIYGCLNSITLLSFILSLFIFILVIIRIKTKINNWNNITVVFLAFWGLYAFVGPYVDLTEGMFNPSYYSYSYPYHTNQYLFYNSLGFISFFISFALSEKLTNKKILNNIQSPKSINYKLLLDLGVFLMIISLFMEMINIFRVGGVSVLFSGKESYQTLVENLPLTLPSKPISIVALSTFMLGLKNIQPKKYINKIILLGILIFPLILVYLLTGSRGALLGYVGIILLGTTYRKPIKKIKIKYILLLFFIYFIMIFITVNRWQITNALSTGNYTDLFERIFSVERYKSRFSLSDNEFVVGLGNFSEGFIDAKNNPRYGETYLKGLALPIPSFLYPTEKPTQILYEFRDTYFPHLKTREGSVGSTGYSLVLEAYINFKGIGVIVKFILLGLIFSRLEYFWKLGNGLFNNILYLASSTLIYTSMRSQFATLYSNSLHFIIYISIVIVLYKLILRNNELDRRLVLHYSRN